MKFLEANVNAPSIIFVFNIESTNLPVMRKIIYFFALLFAVSSARAQCPGFSVSNNSAGFYSFYPDSTAWGLGSSFVWSFGDGSNSTQAFPIHFYIPGMYNVCFDIYDSAGARQCTYCDTLVVSATTNNCFFSAFEDSLTPGLFYFNGAPAYPSSSVVWNFSDGTTDAGLNVIHFFPPGVPATACMNEIDALGNTICSRCDTLVPSGGGTGNCGFITRPDSVNFFSFDFVSQVNYTGYFTVNWSFGDGSAGSGYVGTHLYSSPGTYTVCMEALDSLGNQICNFCNAVTVAGNTPACNFTYTTTPGTGVFVYQAPPAMLYTFTWYSNVNATTYTGNPVTISYSPGVLMDSICLVVTDPSGTVVCTDCQFVFVNNNTPTCQAYFASSVVGLDGYFVDLSQTYTSATSYSWDFGDGSTASSLRFPQHTYSAPGFYNVCLSIQDGTCSNTYCETVYVDTTITPPTFCNAFFVITQMAPYQMAVVNLSSGLNLSYQWSFGDGTGSNQVYPFHTYSGNGPYTLCLTVSDSAGCTSTYCDTISIDSLGNIVYRGVSGFSINVMSPVQITAGIEDAGKTINAAIFPNPASSSIRVQSNDLKGVISFRILNIQGAEAAKGSLNNTSESIRIDQLTPGLYMIEMTDAGQNKVFGRFIKE